MRVLYAASGEESTSVKQKMVIWRCELGMVVEISDASEVIPLDCIVVTGYLESLIDTLCLFA
jgi:hypothetical protein